MSYHGGRSIGRPRRDRGKRFLVAASVCVVSVGLVGLVPVAAGGSAATHTTAAATTQPTLRWGAHIRPSGGQTETQAVQALEQKVGRKLGADREFRLWDQPFPTSYDTWLHDTGHLVLLSVRPKLLNGTQILWRDVADAQPGSAIQDQIDSWARWVKAWGIPIEFTFNHEPEAASNLSAGVDVDFIAAWRHVVETFRADGVTNARYLWITTDYGWDAPTSDRRSGPKWYPGDAWVDDFGADAYNWYHCRAGIDNAWKSLAAIIENFRRFGALHPSKRLWLPEWASTEDPADPQRKAQWIADAQALFKQPGYEQFDGISYFDHINPTFPDCNEPPDSTSQSLAAFRTMGGDPFYGVGLPPQPK